MTKNPFFRRDLLIALSEPSRQMEIPPAEPIVAGPEFQRYIAPTPRTLEQAAKAATDNIDGRALNPPLERGTKPVALAKALLTQLILCYARQIYASTDISDIVRRDKTVSRLCGQNSLEATEISRFRSSNRQVIHRCLIAALEFLTAKKISLGVLTLVSNAQLAEEASRRIIMAGFIDSMELDGSPVMDPPVEFSYLFANNGNESHQ